MSNNSPETNRPLELILDVREHVVSSAAQYQAQQHGIIERDPETVQRKWHVQVLSYYRELKRYQHRSIIEGKWHETIEGFDDLTLADIEDIQFETRQHVTEEFDPDTQQRKRVKTAEMAVFSPQELVQITAKLDECASKLGFDVSTEEQRPIYDAGKRDPEDYDEPVKGSIPKPQ
jgi:hypothetical protein